MAIKFITQCKVCKTIRAEESSDKTLGRNKHAPQLVTRIYRSRQYNRGGESLVKISQDYEDRFTYKGLYKHATTHQAPTEEDLINVRLNKIHDKELVNKVKQLIKHQDVRQEIMERGLEGIRKGEIRLTGHTVLGAANKEADIESKQKDQAIELMKMIQAFQSGELQYQTQEEKQNLLRQQESLEQGGDDRDPVITS